MKKPERCARTAPVCYLSYSAIHPHAYLPLVGRSIRLSAKRETDRVGGISELLTPWRPAPCRRRPATARTGSRGRSRLGGYFQSRRRPLGVAKKKHFRIDEAAQMGRGKIAVRGRPRRLHLIEIAFVKKKRGHPPPAIVGKINRH